MARYARHAAPALLIGLLLTACGHSAPRPRTAAAHAAPGVQAGIKIGKPYQVFGVWYYPADDRGYDERGIASWYGPGFHALSTANGERYDQNDVTAAHKTLPLPSYVEVENLDNGRKLTVRVNDRGPYVAGRIIDLSRRSAQLLGVDGPGTARVRVRRVYPDAATVASLAPRAAPSPPPAPVIEAVAATSPQIGVDAPPPPIRVVELPAGARPAVVAPSPAPVAGQRFVQVAALTDPGRIAWMTGYLGVFGAVVTEKSPSGLTRMRLGPYASDAAANAVLAQVRAAGYSEAVLVTATAGR